MTDGPPSAPAPETQETEHPEKYVVELVGPYSFRVPKSIEGNGYEILLNGVSVKLKLGELEGERAAFQGSGAVEFPLDRHGLLVSQGVEIHFEEEYISSLPDDIEEPAYEDLIMGSKTAGIHKRLIEDSIEYYNRFVQCYKTTTQKYWMRQVTSNEILNFTIKKIDGGEVIDETGLSLTGGSLRMGFIDNQKINRLRQVLSEGTNVTLSRQLNLDAQDKHDLGDYRLSIIQSDLLFVFWTRREYTKMLKADGKSEEYAEDRMWNDGSDEYHHINQIYDMIESDMGVEIKDTIEWRLWNKYCRDMRNKVVHEGYSPDDLDAIYAYYYTRKALREFKQKFINTFN